MYAEISAALTSLKTISELVKAAGSITGQREIQTSATSIHENLTRTLLANLANAEMHTAARNRIRALEEEIQNIKDFKAQAIDYVLQAVGADQRDFVQAYKPAVQVNKARHWACAKCFQEQKIYILNAASRSAYQCPHCKLTIKPIVSGGGLAPIDSAYS